MPAKKTKSTKPAAKKTKKTSSPKKASSPKKRTASTKAKSTKGGDAKVTIDRRRKADRREDSEVSEVEAPKIERREKVQRRRQIDPTTCERDYNVYEVEFMSAMDEYKRTSGRMFPTCSEVLEVIGTLGYVKLTPAELAVVRPEPVKPTDSHEDTANLEGEGFDDEGEFSEDFEPTAVGEVC
jgi:hypothetical protein